MDFAPYLRLKKIFPMIFMGIALSEYRKEAIVVVTKLLPRQWLLFYNLRIVAF
jgi:hypothetical protein